MTDMKIVWCNKASKLIEKMRIEGLEDDPAMIHKLENLVKAMKRCM
jgi:hypothetical protein